MRKVTVTRYTNVFGESGPEKSVCGRRQERRRRNEAKYGRGSKEGREEEERGGSR